MITYFACFVVGVTCKMLWDDHMALLRQYKKVHG